MPDAFPIKCEASKKKLRFMFDLHGVAERMPDLIKPIMKTLRACGHYVIICSGPTISKVLAELDALGYKEGVHYDDVDSVVDYLEKVQKVEFTYDEKGDPWTDEETWYKSKGWLAVRHRVDVVIDDSEQYKANMPENVMFWLMR